MLFTSTDNDIEYDTQIAHPAGVQGVALASGLVGVVADLGPFLFAVQGFDGGVDVQYPGVFNAACTLPSNWGISQPQLCSALMRAEARRRASSLMILFTPSTCGLSASLRSPVMWA